MSLNEILAYLDNSKSVEVSYEGNNVVIKEYKGISKTSAEGVKSLIRGKKSKLDKKRRQIVAELASVLLANRIPFKIILEKDPLVKFDVDRYISIANDSIKIFGFVNENEHPLSFVYNKLSSLGKCVFYKPVK